MEETIKKLNELESRRELTVIKLSDSILASNEEAEEKRGSDASSTAGYGMTTPATYEAELSHYKYVEQVTKEKFINAIVGSEPLHMSAAQNAQLESDVAAAKVSLKAQKTEVERLVSELEQQSRVIAQRHYAVQLQSQQVRQLPAEIQELQSAISRLKEEQGIKNEEEPDQSLPLAKTIELVEQRERDMELLDQQLAAAEATSKRKTRELKRLEDELIPLEAQKNQATAAAREAVRRRDEGMGSLGDEIEDNGRWLAGVQATMQTLLETAG